MEKILSQIGDYLKPSENIEEKPYIINGEFYYDYDTYVLEELTTDDLTKEQKQILKLKESIYEKLLIDKHKKDSININDYPFIFKGKAYRTFESYIKDNIDIYEELYEQLKILIKEKKTIILNKNNMIDYYLDMIFKNTYGYVNIILSLYKDKLVYDSSLKIFYLWDDKIKLWKIIEDKEILLGKFQTLMKDDVLDKIDLYIKQMLINNKDNEKIKIKYDKLKESYEKIKSKLLDDKPYAGIIKIIKNKIENNDFTDLLDVKNKHLLPILNGKVINFITLETRDRVKEDLFSSECKVDFLGINYKSKHGKKFFSSLFQDDDKLIKTKYMQKLFGYCLTGFVDAKLFITLYGQNGNNGKTTLFKLFDTMLGKTFSDQICKDDLFLTNTKSVHQTSMVSLLKLRFGYVSETDKNDILNATALKSMTGDDGFKGRQLGVKQGHKQDLFLKVCVGTNTIFSLSKNDNSNPDHTALLRRNQHIVLKVSFVEDKNKEIPKRNVYYKDAEPDFIENLLKSQEYLNDIFTFLCHGAYKWYHQEKNGKRTPIIIQPDEMIKEKDEYVSNLDKMRYFINNYCNKDLKNKICMKRNDFFNVYYNYSRDEGIIVDKKHVFEELQTKGYEIKQCSSGDLKGNMVIYGIELKKYIDLDDKEIIISKKGKVLTEEEIEYNNEIERINENNLYVEHLRNIIADKNNEFSKNNNTTNKYKNYFEKNNNEN